MNFITKFSKSQNSIIRTLYDIIIIIINNLIKYVKFVFYQLIIIIKQLTHLLIREVFTNYEISKIIIINKNKLFTLTFYKKLKKALKMNEKIFTIFHSQINE